MFNFIFGESSKMFQKFLIMNKNNTKVLLELEFDTEDQVLCYTVFGGRRDQNLISKSKVFPSWTLST